MDRFIAPHADADMAYARLFQPDITPPGRVISRTTTATSTATSTASPSFILTPPPSPQRKAERPSRSLDLPDLTDDYYKNALAWPEPQTLLVGLGTRVHHYDPVQHRVIDSIDAGETVTAVAYQSGMTAIATARGNVALLKNSQTIRRVEHPSRRTLALTFRQEQEWTTGTMQGLVRHHDERTSALSPCVTFKAHSMEVLRAIWSPFQTHHVATGGNDDQVHVYDLRNTTRPFFSYLSHRAAVKALSWSPFTSGMLVSGGGTGDHSIVVHRIATGVSEAPIATVGQVTSVHYVNRGDLVTTHGFMAGDDDDARRLQWHGHANGPIFPLTSSRILDSVLSPNRTEWVTTSSSQRLDFYDLSSFVRRPCSARRLEYVLR